MEATTDDLRPRWQRDLARFLPLKSQFILTGNIRDLQIQNVGGTVAAVTLERALAGALADAGYAEVVHYDPVNGFRVLDHPDGAAADGDGVLRTLGLTPANGIAPGGVEIFGQTLERLVPAEGPPTALIANFASRLVVRSDALSPVEHQLFTRALLLSQNARARPVGRDRTPLFNTVLWVLDKEGDVPDWFVIDNPRVRHVPISPPDRPTRRAIAPSLVRGLPGARDAAPSSIAAAEAALVDETEGLLLIDLSAIAQLARSEGVAIGEVADAVRRYKVGVTDDAWRKIEREKIRSGREIIGKRLIGQERAVVHMLDIVKRAAVGVGGSGRGGRPRGVAFLAGPTGVGKTELAKTVTEMLFGDESAYIRFDMSEFSSEHADQRLIGAPPGYVGYDVGGELTNAIRERPFSVVLFDEIEKAHPRILDKFLQILDDGVLTSGRGDRVYFSEALIIFTSNLGIYRADAAGARVPNVSPEDGYEAVRSKVRAEIESHFKLVLNRPEILNRFGENIIVFDFIRPEVADGIFGSMVDGVLEDARRQGYQVTISPGARVQLRERCVSDLSNGGRGIRNKVEANLLNPLARALFDAPPGGPVEITELGADSIGDLVLSAA